jgi:hypothetical protein
MGNKSNIATKDITIFVNQSRWVNVDSSIKGKIFMSDVFHGGD